MAKDYSARGKHEKLRIPGPTPEGYYPNVQATKNKLAWVKYLYKEDPEPITEGIDAM